MRRLLGSNQNLFQTSIPRPITSIGVRMKTTTQESLTSLMALRGVTKRAGFSD